MAPFQKILFPIDFSEADQAMASEVREIASKCNAELAVLHSFNVVRDYNFAAGLDSNTFPEIPVPYEPPIARLRDEAQLRLRTFAQEQFANLTCTELMEDGDPAAVIRTIVARNNIDLIMMPTKGLGTFRRLLLGSLTAKVLHDTDCAVYTSVHECTLGRPKRSGYRTIVCAVELNEEAEHILKTAACFAELWGGQLSIIHTAHQEGLEPELSSIVRRCGVTAPVLVIDAGVPDGIKDLASKQSADLVIVGHGKDRGMISRLWSDLYEIIRESPCPVLSV